MRAEIIHVTIATLLTQKLHFSYLFGLTHVVDDVTNFTDRGQVMSFFFLKNTVQTHADVYNCITNAELRALHTN